MFSVPLPKWPGIVVKGEQVTKKQAAEIIIRTGDFWFSTNDDEWENQLYQCIGFQSRPYDSHFYDERNYFHAKYKILDIGYLENQRVASSYIFGPYGWIDWDGTVNIMNNNIGIWPTSEEVFEEWQKIADAFPYLSLRCQLYDAEYGENGKPVIEYVVQNGNVSVKEPTDVLEADFVEQKYLNGERGCSLKQFKEALKIVTP